MKWTVLLILLFAPFDLLAQNRLIPADDAVQLRRVWIMIGDDVEGKNRVGQEVGALPDINNDSIDDFVVRTPSGLHVFLGSRGQISSEPYKIIRDGSLIARTPIIGDFWADGRRSVGIGTSYDGPGGNYVDVLELFLLDSGLTLTEKRAVLDPFESLDPPVLYATPALTVIDVDGEAGDELILVEDYLYRGDSLYETAEVWFFLGGPEFQVDSPSVLLRDTGMFGPPSNFTARFADIDGDQRTDMLLSGTYPGIGEMLRFYWGDDESPASWSRRPPDRDLLLDHTIALKPNLGLYDLDGDDVADIGSYVFGDSGGSYIFLSSTGSNARTRSFVRGDADLRVTDAVVSTARSGFINDSVRRYESLTFGGSLPGNQVAYFLVSGGSQGPDRDYEAWYAPASDGLLNESIAHRSTVSDVTGDGYDDQIYGNFQYGIASQGIAVVLAGGPEIPLDDPSTVVEEYPVAGESSGLYLWPNPVDDELHIAWRGNLKRMPARFEVYDIHGELVVESEAHTYAGAMLWECAGVAAGTYLLIAYDNENEPIADARVIKR